MEQYENTFESVDSQPIQEIEKRLRRLGCTQEQVQRHLDELAISRTVAAKERDRKSRR
jgi:hypothetical protein